MDTPPITIISVEKPKGKSRAWRVVLNSGRVFEIEKEIFQFYQIHTHTSFSEEQFRQIVQQSREKLAKDYALDYLGSRSHSEKEVRSRLRKKRTSPHHIQKTIEDLKRVGLINDETFALRCCRDLLKRKPMGIYLLRQELRKRGIPEDIAEDTIDKVTQEYSPHELIQSAMHQKPHYMNIAEDQERNRKMSEHLLRRGFSWDEIREAIGQMENSTSE